MGQSGKMQGLKSRPDCLWQQGHEGPDDPMREPEYHSLIFGIYESIPVRPVLDAWFQHAHKRAMVVRGQDPRLDGEKEGAVKLERVHEKESNAIEHLRRVV